MANELDDNSGIFQDSLERIAGAVDRRCYPGEAWPAAGMVRRPPSRKWRIVCASGLAAAAVVVAALLLVAKLMHPVQPNTPAVAATPSTADTPETAWPVRREQDWSSDTYQGTLYDSQDRPFRAYIHREVFHVQYIDPTSGRTAEVTVPREEVVYVPVENY